MYTTPLSTLISSFSLKHYLYADDTQLFFSFHPRNFDSSIVHLHTGLQQISSWMSANILTLNSSETEFLIIGLKQQLSKIDNSSLLDLELDPPVPTATLGDSTPIACRSSLSVSCQCHVFLGLPAFIYIIFIHIHPYPYGVHCTAALTGLDDGRRRT